MKRQDKRQTELIRVKKTASLALRDAAKRNGRTLVEEASRAIARGLAAERAA